MDPLSTLLLSLILGTLLGGLGKAIDDRYAAFKESQAVAASLRAELWAVLHIAGRRRYVEGLDAMITRLAQPGYVPGPMDVFNVRVAHNFFQVFDALCGKLGLLGDAAAPGVHVYTLAKAIVEDMNRFSDMAEKGMMLDVDTAIAVYTELRDLFNEAFRDGRIAIQRLQQHEGRRFFWRG